jgi:hypothetical protein
MPSTISATRSRDVLVSQRARPDLLRDQDVPVGLRSA